MENLAKTISVILLTYNVEENLLEAVDSVLKALDRKFVDYEILISDGGSKDKTLEMADRLASENKKIKVIRNKNIGMGYSYFKGVESASLNYVTMFPGDNENSGFFFGKTLEKVGEADIIVPYTTNQNVRQFHRKLISDWFVIFMNTLFNLRLKYYNGNAVYKTRDLKKLKVISKDFAYNAEILIRLIKSGHTFVEVGIKIKPSHKTAIFEISNIIGVVKTVFLLFYDIYIAKNVGMSSKNQKI
jgi:glycosyltransferase involved in cell wall biosynthesis